MYASAMTAVRRTTVTASTDALSTLALEACRRGTSLTAVLAEAVEEKAAAIRQGRRPRFGVGASSDGRSAAETAVEPIAEPDR
jgi:hypothetical protein